MGKKKTTENDVRAWARTYAEEREAVKTRYTCSGCLITLVIMVVLALILTAMIM